MLICNKSKQLSFNFLESFREVNNRLDVQNRITERTVPEITPKMADRHKELRRCRVNSRAYRTRKVEQCSRGA